MSHLPAPEGHPASGVPHELLRSLLEATGAEPSSIEATPRAGNGRPSWASPPRLRRQGQQERASVAGETPFDRLLLRGAQALGLGALLCFAIWLLNGPVYDRLFAPPAPVRERPAGAVPVSAPSQAFLPQPATARPVESEPAPSPARAHPSGLRATPLQPALHVLPYRSAGVASAAPVPDPVLEPAFAYRENSEAPEWIQVPAVGIDTPVITVYADGLDWQEADYAAGYLYGTGDPGEAGNVVIAGHAGLRGGVFMPLPSVKIGDDIFVDTASYRFHYRVGAIKVVWPTDVHVLGANANATLTLITCTNWDTQRLVVIADLIGASRHQAGGA